jgi:outer membrane murein-binding lipoprotein Lpp
MNKTLSLLFSFILLATTYTSHSQDTTHRVKKPLTTATRPVYTPLTRPGFRHVGKNRKRDSTLKAVYHTPAMSIKPDTAKKLVAVLPQPTITDNTLSGQYSAINRNLGSYERGLVATFYRNYMDTLKAERHKVKDLSIKLDTLNNKIAGLKSDATVKAQSLSESVSKTNEVSFLGMPMSKSTFSFIMWGLVLVLGAALATVIYLSGANKREAAYRIQLHDELSAEFQTYKAKTNEKEKKLARELQTERNKYDELKEQREKDKKK